MHNFSIFAHISKNDFYDVIHFDDVIFIMDNDDDESSKTFF